jgi:hypothetical protein
MCARRDGALTGDRSGRRRGPGRGPDTAVSPGAAPYPSTVIACIVSPVSLSRVVVARGARTMNKYSRARHAAGGEPVASPWAKRQTGVNWAELLLPR